MFLDVYIHCIVFVMRYELFVQVNSIKCVGGIVIVLLLLLVFSLLLLLFLDFLVVLVMFVMLVMFKSTV